MDPHQDPARWDELIASVTPEAILVVIDRDMGAALRAHCQPEDVWQETLALAWRDRAQHRWIDARVFRAWVIAIARNRVKMIAREIAAQKRGDGRKAVLFSGMDLPEGASLSQLLPAGSTTPSRIAHQSEEARIIARALEDLPEDEREIVRLRLFEEVTVEEAARRLDVAVHVARYRLMKGTERFARALRTLRSSADGSGA